MKKFNINNSFIYRSKGLSLIEVMIASIIIIIIIIAAGTVFPVGFKINEQNKQFSSAENIGGAELELISSLKYSDIAPSPFPSSTPSPNVPLIDTTNYTYGVQNFILKDTRFPNSQITYSYPKKVTVNKLDSAGKVIGQASYRVDIKVYLGKFNELAYLDNDEKFYLIRDSLINFFNPYALAAPCTCDLSVSPSSNICIGTNLTFNANIANCGTTNTWDMGDGNTLSGPTVNYTYNTPGNYTVTFTSKQASAVKCTKTLNVSVMAPSSLSMTIFQNPYTTPLNDPIIGYLNTTSFRFRANPSTCASSGTVYKWNFGPGEGNDIYGQEVDYIFTTTGNKTVTLISQNPAGTTTRNIQIKESTANISITPSTGNTNTIFTFTGSGTDIGSSPVYLWNFGDYTPVVTGQTVSHQFTQPGTYNIKLNITGGSNPEKIVPLTVGTVGGKDVNITSITPNPALPNETITFTASSVGLTSPTFSWNFGDGSPNKIGNPITYSYPNGGNYVVTLNVSDGADTLQRTSNVVINSTATLSANPTKVNLSNGTATINFVVNTSGVPSGATYLWNFGDGTSTNSVINNTSHTYTSTGIYNVTVTVNGGSNPSASTQVTIDPEATVTSNQSLMKKIYIKVAPWSVAPPNNYLATFTTIIANNDKR